MSFIDHDTLKDQDLSSVCKDWQLIFSGNQRRRQVGTIVLRSPTDNFSVLYNTHGLTIATLYQLAHHYTKWWIPPDQYDCVQIDPNIREYQQIRNPLHQFELENTLQAQYIIPGVPFGYNKVTTLDCHDTTDDDVTGNLDARENVLVDIFYPGGQVNRRTGHFTFVSNLLAWFFYNVTSLNLSATRWSNYALHSIPWIKLEILIWNKCLCFDLLLPHLSAAENLLKLRLDYSTLLVNDETVTNLLDLITDDHEYTIFHHLKTCSKLKIFSCAHCRIH